MDYPMLRKMKKDLMAKEKRTPDEDALLKELKVLGPVIDMTHFSLSLSDVVCKACGRPL